MELSNIVLGNSTITVSDFSMLQVGDIIRLDRDVEDELDVYVGNLRKFSALPGQDPFLQSASL